MRKLIIEKGDKFNKLTAVRFDHKDKKYIKYWLFKCDCGKEKVIVVGGVKSGHTKSCGCLLKKGGRLTHGMRKTKIYSSWTNMKTRCLNKNDENYKDWGGRGITICPEWLGENGFQNFYNDMGEAPKGKSLDRINNNGNYCKKNCKWSTQKEQCNNTRRNIK